MALNNNASRQHSTAVISQQAWLQALQRRQRLWKVSCMETCKQVAGTAQGSSSFSFGVTSPQAVYSAQMSAAHAANALSASQRSLASTPTAHTPDRLSTPVLDVEVPAPCQTQLQRTPGRRPQACMAHCMRHVQCCFDACNCITDTHILLCKHSAINCKHTSTCSHMLSKVSACFVSAVPKCQNQFLIIADITNVSAHFPPHKCRCCHV